MSESIPVVDLAPLIGDAPGGLEQVAAAIGHACRSRGFFYIRNHGVPDRLIAAVFAQSAAFFAQPVADKEALSITHSRHNRGYVALEGENLDPGRPGDAKEAFNIGRELAPDDPDLLAGVPFHAPNQWPAAPGFRATMLDYFTAQHALCATLHRAFATDLGLGPDFFAGSIDRPLAVLRLLHYPPHPSQFDGSQYGAGPHTDYGNVTTLAQDDAGGLEVRTRDGQWIDATPIPGTFVCNIGDCLMRWSNDTYVSTPHRVVNRSGRERYSVVFFCDPNADARVECLPTCMGEGRPARYPPTTGAAYLKERLDATYSYRQTAG
jgi:isopenicillin N synthase-like dioxygenase